MKPFPKNVGVLALIALAGLGYAQAWNFTKVNPTATYLRDSQWAPDASMIDLGITGPEWVDVMGGRLRIKLEIRSVGWFNRALDNPAAHNVSNQAVAVFSTSNFLNPDWSQQYRVSAAEDAGDDFYTLPTWVGSRPTDIVEDFGAGPSEIVLDVPLGAHYLMLTPYDNGFWNNGDDFSMPGADPRGFGVEWQVDRVGTAPEPTVLLVLGAGLAGLLRRRKSAKG